MNYHQMPKAQLEAHCKKLEKEQHAQARLGNVRLSSLYAGELVTATLALAQRG